MLVFWEQRLVVLATPKAGSTAVATALESLAALSVQRPAALKHTTVRDYHSFFRPYLEKTSGAHFTAVALMREPQEWLGSWYRFYQKPDHMDTPQSTRAISFDDFVQAWCADDPPAYANFGTQSDFLTPGVADEGLDHLFRYAEIGRFVQFLEDRLHFEITLPQVNVSPLANLALTDDTALRMRRRASADIALYQSLQRSV
jgi:hypothetical protein